MFAVPDIFYRGEMIWAKGIGLDCCYVGLRFLLDVAEAETILDPFCGKGTVMAMANQLGMHAVGVEISRKRCRQASRMRMGLETMARVSEWANQISLGIVEHRKRLKDNDILHVDEDENGKDEGGDDDRDEDECSDFLAVEESESVSNHAGTGTADEQPLLGIIPLPTLT